MSVLTGKTAIVTGSARGIGRAAATLLVKHGAQVVIADVDEALAAETAAELGNAVASGGDLTADGVPEAIVRTAVDSFGRLDIVVNNVAFQNPTSDLSEISDEQWRRTFAVNIDSFFHVTKAALQHLPDGSAIINTASINGLRGNKSLIDYSATKGAVIALTYSLAQSLTDRNIRVNCVAPGPVWTPLQVAGGQTAEGLEKFGSDTPYGRPGEPAELAGLYVTLAEAGNSYTSGSIIGANGGSGVS